MATKRKIIVNSQGKKVGGNFAGIHESGRHSFFPGKYILDDQGTAFHFSQGFKIKDVCVDPPRGIWVGPDGATDEELYSKEND